LKRTKSRDKGSGNSKKLTTSSIKSVGRSSNKTGIEATLLEGRKLPGTMTKESRYAPDE
jgi:hypothetical protein